MKSAAALALALLTGAAQAQTAPSDLAYGAYQRGLFRTALSEALKRIAADPKDGAAMTLVGEITRDGAAVKQDVGEAAHWFKLADGLGDGQGAFETGALLIAGAPGVPADRDAALAAFGRAAAKGVPQAYYNLAIAATQDKGQKPDFAKAAALFRQGAEAGVAQSAYALGALRREGQGVAKDPADAAHWLKAAADAWLPEAQVEYAIMLFNGEGVAPNEAEAAAYLRRAAGRHNAIAQNRLAHLYLSGRGVPKDLALAAAWGELAKSAGLTDTGLEAGIGKLSPEDDHRAAQLIRAYAAF